MAQALRVVERLRLRAPSDALVRRAVVRLDDALRTASLPDRGARIVIVRRLALGRIAANASAQSLALALEAGLASLGARFVHAEASGAERAEAVWFRDTLEAHGLAALRAAAGSPLHAWFWPLAVPALTPSGAMRPVLRALAYSLAALDEAPAALPHWTATLVLAGHADRLVAALRPGDGATLLGFAGLAWDRAMRIDGTSEARPQADPSREPSWTATRARDAAYLECGVGDVAEWRDDRHVFVRAMLRQAGAPRTATHPATDLVVRPRVAIAAEAAKGETTPVATHELSEIVRELDRRAGAATPFTAEPTVDLAAAVAASGHDRSREPALGTVTTVDDAVAVSGTRRDVSLGARSSGAAEAPGLERGVREVAGARATPEGSAVLSERVADGERADRSERVDRLDRGERIVGRSPSGHPTRAGGLLMLVPVLERVGFERWWLARADAHSGPLDSIAGVIFARLLERLRVERDDPMWGVASMGAPRRSRALPPAVADGWLYACRRLLRRRVRLGLGSLVLRPARVALTPTHADVFFARDAVDLRVRRAGLDIDPGWVRWLGRVLAFHYGDERWT